jgi:hypothetical protein
MKPKKAALRSKTSTADPIARFVLQLSLVSLSGTLKALCFKPIGSFLSLYLVCGRLTVALLSWLQTELSHAVAWLFQPVFSNNDRNGWIYRLSRQYGLVALKRWQGIAGESAACSGPHDKFV